LERGSAELGFTMDIAAGVEARFARLEVVLQQQHDARVGAEARTKALEEQRSVKAHDGLDLASNGLLGLRNFGKPACFEGDGLR